MHICVLSRSDGKRCRPFAHIACLLQRLLPADTSSDRLTSGRQSRHCVRLMSDRTVCASLPVQMLSINQVDQNYYSRKLVRLSVHFFVVTC